MNKYMMIAIVFAVTVAFIVGILLMNNKGISRPSSTEGNEVDVMIEANKPISDKAIEALKEADHITIEKVERVIRENSEGAYITNYDTYLVSSPFPTRWCADTAYPWA